MSDFACPNERHGDSLKGLHQFFVRRYMQMRLKTFTGNGRQWAPNEEVLLEDEPVGEMRCLTCGVVAEEVYK